MDLVDGHGDWGNAGMVVKAKGGWFGGGGRGEWL